MVVERIGDGGSFNREGSTQGDVSNSIEENKRRYNSKKNEAM